MTILCIYMHTHISQAICNYMKISPCLSTSAHFPTSYFVYTWNNHHNQGLQLYSTSCCWWQWPSFSISSAVCGVMSSDERQTLKVQRLIYSTQLTVGGMKLFLPLFFLLIQGLNTSSTKCSETKDLSTVEVRISHTRWCVFLNRNDSSCTQWAHWLNRVTFHILENTVQYISLQFV